MKNDFLQEPTYSTKDLGAATYLVTQNHELTGTTLQEPRKLIFHFRRQENTDNLILAYFNGTGSEPAKKLFENYRTLRGLVYSRTNNVR